MPRSTGTSYTCLPITQVDQVCAALEEAGIMQLYVVGDLYSLRISDKITARLRKKAANVSVVVIPLSIEDEFGVFDRSFGYTTAVEQVT